MGGHWKRSAIGSGMEGSEAQRWVHGETGQDFWNRGCGQKHKVSIKMELFRAGKS